jgi:hypothetical protein
MLWTWLSRSWHGWRSTIHIFHTETIVVWHRRGFRLFWTWKSRHRTVRPPVPHDVRALIREMSTANLLWRAPRIHGESGISGGSVHRRQAHAAAATAAVADLAHVLTNHASRSWPPARTECSSVLIGVASD